MLMKARMMRLFRKRSLWMVVAAGLVAGTATVPLVAHVRPRPSSTNAGQNANQSHVDPSAALPYDAASTDARPSIYDLTRSWHDQDGVPRQLSDLRDTVWLLAMVYTHCAVTCPTLVQNMKHVADSIPAARHGAVKFVLVSLDPGRDTPGRLRDYATMMGLPLDRWRLLNGSDDAVRELAAAIGIRYQRLSAEEIAHSNLVTVFDRSGAVAMQSIGGTDEGAMMEVLRSLLGREAR
jgi:protein SCO1/2